MEAASGWRGPQVGRRPHDALHHARPGLTRGLPLSRAVRPDTEKRHPPVSMGSTSAYVDLTRRRPLTQLGISRSLARERHPEHLTPSCVPDIGHDRFDDQPRHRRLVGDPGGDHGVRAPLGENHPLNRGTHGSTPRAALPCLLRSIWRRAAPAAHIPAGTKDADSMLATLSPAAYCRPAFRCQMCPPYDTCVGSDRSARTTVRRQTWRPGAPLASPQAAGAADRTAVAGGWALQVQPGWFAGR